MRSRRKWWSRGRLTSSPPMPWCTFCNEIRFVIDEALRCREKKEAKVIVFNNSGHGLLDLSAYQSYLDGKLEDWAPTKIEYPNMVA